MFTSESILMAQIGPSELTLNHPAVYLTWNTQVTTLVVPGRSLALFAISDDKSKPSLKRQAGQMPQACLWLVRPRHNPVRVPLADMARTDPLNHRGDCLLGNYKLT